MIGQSKIRFLNRFNYNFFKKNNKFQYINFMNTKKKMFLALLFIFVLIFTTIFWRDIKEKYFFLAYKEKCLVSIINREKSMNLEKGNQICDCIITKIKENNIQLNTSKLYASKMINHESGKPIPIDRALFKAQCIKSFHD